MLLTGFSQPTSNKAPRGAGPGLADLSHFLYAGPDLSLMLSERPLASEEVRGEDQHAYRGGRCHANSRSRLIAIGIVGLQRSS